MPPPISPSHLGDSHNFGRRVTLTGARIHKPRPLLWEWLLLSAASPLRRLLDEAAPQNGLPPDAFSFLPNLAFFPPIPDAPTGGGEVERIDLAPLPPLSPERRRALAQVTGRALALFSWLGLSDLHWENLVLGEAQGGRILLAPLDVEMILADLSLPTETKLLPDADPEYAVVCRHAAGVRRVLPYLGKPLDPEDLVALAAAYRATVALLDRLAPRLADVFSALPAFRETPIRILLRGTGDYVHAATRELWPPLLDAEAEQLARGDIPYFFRLYGQPGIHYYGASDLRHTKHLPLEGDVPRLDPILQVARALRSPTRKKLREEGLFTVLGAFDHPSFKGTYAADGFEVTFRTRTLVLKLPKKGEELESRRNLQAFVGSVYLPCTCGEVRTAFVPPVTTCDAPADS